MNSTDIFDKLYEKNIENKFSTIIGFQEDINQTDPNQEIEESGDIFDKISVRESNKKNDPKTYGIYDTAVDVLQQGAKGFAQGVSGAYGNIASAIGLKSPTQEKDPYQEPYFNLLDKLPTSEESGKFIEENIGIGEGKTPAGRIAQRGAQFAGEGIAFPGSNVKALTTLAGSGISGQGIRELGGSEGLASGVEIGTSIIPSLVQGRLAPKKGSEAEKLVEGGRAIGLTEKEITPLVQSEKKAATLSKVARKNKKELFTSIKESLGNSYDRVKQQVSNFGSIDKQNTDNLIKKYTDISTDLKNTLKASPDKEAAIKYVDDVIEKLQKTGVTPEQLINTWQDINKSVNWNKLDGGKKALSRLKEPISEVLQNTVPGAAKDFEITNALYTKYAQIKNKLKPDVIDSIFTKGEIFASAPAAMALATGNITPITSLASGSALRSLASEMLTNPYFQDIGNKLVKNFNSSSVKGVSQTVKQVREFMERKYPDDKWNFLTDGLDLEE